ncbi:MAG: hypothetical protein RLZZ127_2666 [Planctomycetota bacterium]|jgi:hypothetical protein
MEPLPSRPGTAQVDLEGFCIATWMMAPDRVLPFLPPRLAPRTTMGCVPRALVSAVAFRDLHLRPEWWPGPGGLCCWQVNYRIYAIDRATGRDVVWFLATAIGSRWGWIPRTLWGMPWHPVRFTGSLEGGSVSLRCADPDFACDLSVTSGAPLVSVPGFADIAEAQRILTDPQDGWFRRRDDVIARYRIHHPAIPLRGGTAQVCRFAFLESLGLVERGQALHSLITCPSVRFRIQLPPAPVPDAPA